MTLAAFATPSNLAAAVILGAACMLFVAMAAGRFLAESHAPGDGEWDDAVFVTLRDRDGMIAERSALTLSPTLQPSGAPHAKRYRVDRRRHAHPGE